MHLMEANDFHCRLWVEAFQPVEELHQHFQSFLLGGLHVHAHFRNLGHITSDQEQRTPELMKVLLLKHHRVVENELVSAFERLRDRILREVPKEGGTDVGEHEGNIVG